VGKLPRLDLSGERLAGASAREATLIGGRLEGTDLSGATLSDARLEGAILIGGDLRGASAWYADLGHANLTRADLGRLPNPPGTLGADGRPDPWRETNLTDANLEGAILVGATLQGAWLTHANLVGADLRGADLRGAQLRRARLHRADLTGAILSGADLRYATGLTQGQLDRAIGDDTTLFTPPLALTPARTYPERHFQVPDCWTSEAMKLAELFGGAADRALEALLRPAAAARLGDRPSGDDPTGPDRQQPDAGQGGRILLDPTLLGLDVRPTPDTLPQLDDRGSDVLPNLVYLPLRVSSCRAHLTSSRNVRLVRSTGDIGTSLSPRLTKR
jgi:uncharacterized protein YjbI with pentapeptide repeats